MDGKIRFWLYDNVGPGIEYRAPGFTCIGLAYNDDGTRFFSLGTSNDGVSSLLEWNEYEGHVKRSYEGLVERQYPGTLHFDIANSLLAAGDNFSVKFWDIDNEKLFTSTMTDGGLPAAPCVRFSKDGILLAVSSADNGVKILGNSEGYRLITSLEDHGRC
ncbi:topless-related protein 4-like [Rutidosis leptorrhynchoides]|uniref:topless-related protein 4-like n=1 Tax=Rutidosis leptorrhynchoides TaxID=125765 RepID=UPI003A9970F3